MKKLFGSYISKRFLLYSLRWELSSLVLAPVAILVAYFGYENKWFQIILGNFLGSIVFFTIDRRIFKERG